MIDPELRANLRRDIDDLAQLVDGIRETADSCGLKRTAQLLSTAEIILDAASLGLEALDLG